MDAVKFEVPPELFVTTESSSFAGQLAIPVMKAGPIPIRSRSPLTGTSPLPTPETLLVMGSARGTATVACARCLDDFQVDLNGEVEGYFLLDEEGPAPEDMDDDEFEVLSVRQDPRFGAAHHRRASGGGSARAPVPRGLRRFVRAVRRQPQRGAVRMLRSAR